jgi:peptide chain release factor 2
LDKTESEIKALEYEVNSPDFWQDSNRAKETSQKLSALREEVKKWKDIGDEVSDLIDLGHEAEKEKDNSFEEETKKHLEELKARFAKLEFFVLFGGKYDKNNVIMAIHAGTGGTDAQDWAEMLLRMYMRFCARHNLEARIIDESRGGEAGIKSVTLDIRGAYAYGWLKSEAGVHRLVRISPFDAEKMRHTSFALVEVLPELGELVEIKIDPKDLRVDTYLSSGHGGQSVQTTYSAVRITHLPTGIVVTCQNERSQQQNKETAMRVLRARLHKIYESEREGEKQKLRGEYKSAEWGNQARSYVLQPYQMVKDHRTKFETADVAGVLDGKLDSFVESFLRSKIGE